ncbi:MAG: hypothetical protein GQ546_09050 [Gammaproteobacteria bacterium]|nr:hypothetical protein [Gammaproteobacteria bacterium]
MPALRTAEMLSALLRTMRESFTSHGCGCHEDYIPDTGNTLIQGYVKYFI